MIIKKLSTKENNQAIEELLEAYSSDTSVPIPSYEPQLLSLAAYDGESYLGGLVGR